MFFFVQGGEEGGNALADTIPLRYEDIPFGGEFSYLNGDVKNEHYREGIYVKYRYGFKLLALAVFAMLQSIALDSAPLGVLSIIQFLPSTVALKNGFQQIFLSWTFPHGSGGFHGDNQPLPVAVLKMDKTSSVGFVTEGIIVRMVRFISGCFYHPANHCWKLPAYTSKNYLSEFGYSFHFQHRLYQHR